MRKLSVRFQITLVLWRYMLISKKSWKSFLLEILAKCLLAALVYIISEKGEWPKPIWPLDDDEPNPGNNLRVLYNSPSAIARNIIERMRRNPGFHHTTFERVKNETDLVAKWSVYDDSNLKFVGIVFEKASTYELSYRIRLSDALEDSKYTFTEPVFHKLWRMHYARFLTLQCEIDSAFISQITGKDVRIPLPEDIGGRVELDAYHKARLIQKFVSWTGLYACTTLFSNIVQEKESLEKDHLSVLGIHPGVLCLGRFLESLMKSVVTNAVVCVMMSRALTIPWIWLWVYIIFYHVKISAILFFMSVFLKNRVTALTFVLTVWTTGGVLGQLFLLYSMAITDEKAQMVISFFMPNTALAVGFLLMSKMEVEQYTVDPKSVDQYTKQLLEMLGIMTASTLFFWGLAIYLDPMLQPEKGVTWKPWPFGKRSVMSNISDEASSLINVYLPRAKRNERLPYEDRPDRSIPVISFRNVTKNFRNGRQVSQILENINLDVFKNEVTALLGENGCGKSLTIAMLIGWKLPSEGKITVQGLDAAQNESLSIIHANIGWCPQENQIISGLTIRELLQFGCKLRRLTEEKEKQQIKKILNILSLYKVRHKKPSGMPHSILRRICFAFAIIGRPRIILLDEPATGVDFHWRKQMWKLTKDLRGNRVILLATNHMGDAEEIADRIIFLGGRKVVCWGSPQFLKEYFHCGYEVTVERSYKVPSSAIKRTILDHYPDALRRFSSLGLLVFILPPEVPNRMAGLVRALRQLGVDHLSLRPTGIEDVFLKATQTTKPKPKTGSGRISTEPEKYTVTFKWSNQWKKFLALSKKELIHMMRAWPLFAFGATLLFVAMAFFMHVSEMKLNSVFGSQEHAITLKTYRGPVFYDVGNITILPTLATSFQELVKESHGDPEQVSNIRKALKYEEMIDKKLANIRIHVAAHLDSFESPQGELIPGLPAYTRSGTHSPAVSVNLLSNAVLRALGNRSVGITTVNSPLRDSWHMPALRLVGPWLWPESMLLVLGMWLAAFGRAPVEERLWGAQHEQLACGASGTVYWLARFMCHATVHTVMMAVLLLTTLLSGRHVFSCPSPAGTLFTSWFLFGLAAIPFIYFLTQFFSVVGYIKWIIIVLVAETAYGYFEQKFPIFKKITIYIDPVGYLFPTHVMKGIFLELQKRILDDSPCRLDLPDCQSSGISKPSAKEKECLTNRNYNAAFTDLFLALLGQSLGYMLLLILKDSTGMWLFYQNFFRKTKKELIKKREVEEDESVTIERRSARAAFEKMLRARQRHSLEPVLPQACMLLAAGAIARGSKSSRPRAKYALSRRRRYIRTIVSSILRRTAPEEGLWLRVLSGECLGLLGSDLSSKTKILEILGGRRRLSKGDVVGVAGSLKKSRSTFTANVGYCSECGGLMPTLTGQEHLELYCNLRGVNHRVFTEQWDPILELDSVLHRPVRVLSQGHKRLLAVTLAIVGMPSAILLERAANSMDTRSRRRLASAFSVLTSHGRSIVLSTNWWPEVRTLCHRVAFVVGGRLIYIGSLLFLRDRLRTGFNVTFRTDGSAEVRRALEAAMTDEGMFGRACTLRGVDRGNVSFYIKDPKVDWDVLVERLESVKERTPGVLHVNFSDMCPADTLKTFARQKSFAI